MSAPESLWQDNPSYHNKFQTEETRKQNKINERNDQIGQNHIQTNSFESSGYYGVQQNFNTNQESRATFSSLKGQKSRQDIMKLGAIPYCSDIEQQSYLKAMGSMKIPKQEDKFNQIVGQLEMQPKSQNHQYSWKIQSQQTEVLSLSPHQAENTQSKQRIGQLGRQQSGKILESPKSDIQNNIERNMIPIGSFAGMLFLSQLALNKKINISIPDTIISGAQFETRYLTNSPYQHQNEAIDNGDSSIVRGIQSKQLNHSQIETTLCSWLQKNIEKSKLGSFVPICIAKQKNMKPKIKMDFFVVSGVQNFNMLLKATKNTMVGNDGMFIMQRYVPSKEEQCIKYRSYWKKNKGFKFYKLNSILPLNGQSLTPIIQIPISPKQQSSSAEGKREAVELQNLNHIKLLNFNEIAGDYKKVQVQINQQKSQIHQITPQLANREVKIDYTSVKNQQHLLLQKEIQSKYSIQEQFTVVESNQKLFTKSKIRPKTQDCQKILGQIQKQLIELVQILNEEILKNEGFELQKLAVDFLQDYQDDQIYFLEINSYLLLTLPEPKYDPYMHNVFKRRQNSYDENAPSNQHFNCNGDYCYIQEKTYVPKHLTPIVAQLMNFQVPKVSKKTVFIERENIKDNYRLFNQDQKLFKTMIEQEVLLHTSLDECDVDVCPTCYHVYQYLDTAYYNPGSQNVSNSGPQFIDQVTNSERQSELQDNIIVEEEQADQEDDTDPYDELVQTRQEDFIDEESKGQELPSSFQRADDASDNSKQAITFNVTSNVQSRRDQSQITGREGDNQRSSPSYNIGTDIQSSPEEFNDRETGFKIPSSNNMSHILNNKRDQSLSQQMTTFNNQSKRSETPQETPPKANNIGQHRKTPSDHNRYYNNIPKPVVVVKKQSAMKRKLSNATAFSDQEKFDKFVDTEFNPIPKYKIHSNQINMQIVPTQKVITETFGPQINLRITPLSKCEIQTFDIANIPAQTTLRKLVIKKPPLATNKYVNNPSKGSRSSIEDYGTLSYLNNTQTPRLDESNQIIDSPSLISSNKKQLSQLKQTRTSLNNNVHCQSQVRESLKNPKSSKTLGFLPHPKRYQSNQHQDDTTPKSFHSSLTQLATMKQNFNIFDRKQEKRQQAEIKKQQQEEEKERIKQESQQQQMFTLPYLKVVAQVPLTPIPFAKNNGKMIEPEEEENKNIILQIPQNLYQQQQQQQESQEEAKEESKKEEAKEEVKIVESNTKITTVPISQKAPIKPRPKGLSRIGKSIISNLQAIPRLMEAVESEQVKNNEPMKFVQHKKTSANDILQPIPVIINDQFVQGNDLYQSASFSKPIKSRVTGTIVQHPSSNSLESVSQMLPTLNLHSQSSKDSLFEQTISHLAEIPKSPPAFQGNSPLHFSKIKQKSQESQNKADSFFGVGESTSEGYIVDFIAQSNEGDYSSIDKHNDPSPLKQTSQSNIGQYQFMNIVDTDSLHSQNKDLQ